VRSRRGESFPVARITDEVAPGVLFMAMHFPQGANALTNTALDPLSKMPELKHSAVAVEMIKEGS
jgi:formate dehydrogenase major subunit